MRIYTKFSTFQILPYADRSTFYVPDFTLTYSTLSLWYQRDYLYSCYYRRVQRMDRVDWFWKIKQDLKKEIESWK